MKKLIAILVAALLMLSFAACSETASENVPKKTKEPANIFERAEGEYCFASGAGAWGTRLELDDDGEFDGGYHNWDAEIGEEYPDGTTYTCDFEGKFEVNKKLSEYSYELKIKNIVFESPAGTEEIRGKIRYVYSEPLGLKGEEFILYTPETPVSEIPEACIYWYGRWAELEDSEVLGTWCIYDTENETAFYMYE